MSLFFRDFESLGQYHDFWATILLSAPDEFQSFDDREVDQKAALEEAFDVLRSGFHFAARKVKDPRTIRIMLELIEMAHEAYKLGDTKTGAHSLQECEGMIWPSRQQRVKYAVEAENRAFGKVISYAGITVSPYPYEGTEQDLNNVQSKLYATARLRCLEHLDRKEDFKPFVLIMSVQNNIQELRFRSWKKATDQIRELAARGDIVGFVRAEVTPSGMYGIAIYLLESLNAAQVSVRSLVKNYQSEAPRFHLDEPAILSEILRNGKDSAAIQS